MKMKLIYIEWEDAVASPSWYTLDELEAWSKRVNTIVKEVGWLFSETDTHLVLISRVCIGTDSVHETYGAIQKIPKTWIKLRINLTKYVPK